MLDRGRRSYYHRARVSVRSCFAVLKNPRLCMTGWEMMPRRLRLFLQLLAFLLVLKGYLFYREVRIAGLSFRILTSRFALFDITIRRASRRC